MKKLAIVLMMMFTTVCFGEVYSKIKSVEKSCGNLRIKVVFYNGTDNDTMTEESYYIADNEVAEATLIGFVKKKIAGLEKPVVVEVKPVAEIVNANIIKDQKIRKVYNF